MNPRVKAVKPNPDYTLTLLFTNGEVRSFDVKPYLDIGISTELKDMSLFNSVKPFLGSVQWKNGQDFCPDTLYLDSVPCPDSVEQWQERDAAFVTPAGGDGFDDPLPEHTIQEFGDNETPFAT